MTLNGAKAAFLVWRRVRMIREVAAVDVAVLIAKTHSTRWSEYLCVLESQLALRYGSAWAADPAAGKIPLSDD